LGFRETLKYLVFKRSEQEAEGQKDLRQSVTLEEIARPPVSLTTPASEIPAPDGAVDFPAVFRSAGIVADTPFATAEKAMELRKNFSALPEATQVESVEATLKTFGIAEQVIVADAVAKGEAIEAYLEGTQGETKEIVDRINTEIAGLTKQIEEKKKKVQERMTFQDTVNRTCQEEMETYADLVRFLASNDPRSASS
jgi:Ni,Fe-hydrogenase III small subunit